MSDNTFENDHEDDLKKSVLMEAKKHLERGKYLVAIRDFNHLLLLGSLFEGYFGLFKAYSSIFFSQDEFPCFMAAGDLALIFGHKALEYSCHPTLIDELSAIYFVTGEAQVALELIEQGLSEYPDNFNILSNASEYLGYLGGPSNINRAISLLDKAIKQVVENKEDINKGLSVGGANNDAEDDEFDRARYLIENMDYEKRKLEKMLKNTQPELKF